MSVAGVTTPPVTCSGAMYSGVPIIPAAPVSPGSCAEGPGVEWPGNAEVGDDHPGGLGHPFAALVAVRDQEDVAALEVPVDDALGVRRRQAVAHLDDQRQRLGWRQPPPLPEARWRGSHRRAAPW